MIITCKKQVPTHWIIFAMMPWAAFNLMGQVMGTAFIFSLKKFLDNPAGLTFILSLPSYVSLVVTPLCAMLSDRIWTRFGRRKPFVITAWIGQIIALICLPLAPNLWLLITAYLVFACFGNIGASIEPLKQEIVPPHERGRSASVMAWYVQFTTLFFYFIAIGRFDDKNFIAGFPITGEAVMYWAAGMLLFIVLLLITLGIKEVKPHPGAKKEKFKMNVFFGRLIDRELWPVYFLQFAGSVFGASMGPLGNLLYTEQWNYTKQDFGTNVAIGGVINLLLIGGLAVVADRWNRLKAYQILLIVILTINATYYFYITRILPDQRPSLAEQVVLGEAMSITATLLGIVGGPLVWDYITRDKMGTFLAGASIISNLTSIVTLTGVGIFLQEYTLLFRPPAGEMNRVVLREEAHKADIEAIIQSARWTLPQDGSIVPSAKIRADAWYGNGLVSDGGTAWEIRLPDGNSEQLEAQREKLDQESSSLTGRIALLRTEASQGAGTTAEADTDAAQLSKVNAQVSQLQHELDARADNLRHQVEKAFGDRILADGEQILSAKTSPALVVQFPIKLRPDSHKLEKLLDACRAENPAMIDLRPVKMGDNYGLAISGLLTSESADASVINALASSLVSTLQNEALRFYPGLVPKPVTNTTTSKETAAVLDLRTVENPVAFPLSPINRVVYSISDLFTGPEPPDLLVASTARSLRIPGEMDHVRITSGRGKSITVVALLSSSFPKYNGAPDAVLQRLQALLGPSAPGDEAAQIRLLYDRVASAAADERITLAQPFLKVSYAKMRYDYMCGYIWTFFMGLIGLGLTFLFALGQKRGLIRKLGVEEAKLA